MQRKRTRRRFFDTGAERPIFKTRTTLRDGYGPVTEFLAGWEPANQPLWFTLDVVRTGDRRDSFQGATASPRQFFARRGIGTVASPFAFPIAPRAMYSVGRTNVVRKCYAKFKHGAKYHFIIIIISLVPNDKTDSKTARTVSPDRRIALFRFHFALLISKRNDMRRIGSVSSGIV